MLEKIRLKTLPIDDTVGTHRKYVGILTEKLAVKRLALLNATVPSDVEQLSNEVREVLAALERAREVSQ
jgi:hypothetical protein